MSATVTAAVVVACGLAAATSGSDAAAMSAPEPAGVRAAPVAGKVAGDVGATRIVTDGWITSTARSGDEILVNGNFDRIGRFTGSAVALDGDGARLDGFPTLDGMVSVSVPDGAGGWFVGGDFGSVGGERRPALAHLTADGTLALDVPTVRGRVYALGLAGDVLYVGGDFDRIGGVTRDSLAAVDVTTGAVTAFAPTTDGHVSELLHVPARGTRSERVLATTNNAGDGSTRLRAYDADGGARTSGFTPGTLRGTGGELALDRDRVYVGAGGVVALDAETGELDADFAAGGQQIPAGGGVPDDLVFTLLLDGNRLLVGGRMESVGGAAGALLALDTTSGAADPTFDAAIRATRGTYGAHGVLDLALVGDDLWAAGRFSRVAGRAASNLALLDPTTGTARDVDLPRYDAQINAVDVSDGRVLTGGLFFMVDAIDALGLAHLDATTLEPLSGSTSHVPWRLRSMLPLGDTIFLADTNDPGPDGPEYGDQHWSRTKGSVIAVDAETGRRTTSLSLIGVPGLATAAVGNGRLYAVRRLDDRTFPRTEIGVFSATTGRLQRTIEVPLRGYVTEIRLAGDDFLLAGSFKRTRPGGQRADLALLRLTGAGRVTPFDVFLDGPITDLTDAPSPLYVSGFFSDYLGRREHRGLAKVSSLRTGGVSGRFQGAGQADRVIVLGDRLLTIRPGRFLDADTGRRLADPSGGLAVAADDAEPMPGGRVALLTTEYYDNLGGQGFVRLQFIQPVD